MESGGEMLECPKCKRFTAEVDLYSLLVICYAPNCRYREELSRVSATVSTGEQISIFSSNRPEAGEQEKNQSKLSIDGDLSKNNGEGI
jgi:hypothetical protein